MAEEYKIYNLKDPKTGEKATQISSKEEFDTLKQKLNPNQIENPRTGQEGTGESIVKEEASENQADAVNIAKELGKVLANALREHGDEMQGIFIKDMNTRGVTIKVTYKPDEQGQQTEDEFVFRWDNGVVRLDNVGNPVDLGQIQNKSGRSTIQKDVLKDRLLQFLSSHDSDPAPSDPAEIPDGTPVNEEENLWESEECQEAFCNAVTNFRNNTKDKEAIKALLRAARPYQKGNTIQEKLKGAVDWYNWFTENPPKNTKEQVFLEDDSVDEGQLLERVRQEVIKPLVEAVSHGWGLATYFEGFRPFYSDLVKTAIALQHWIANRSKNLEPVVGFKKENLDNFSKLEEYGWYPDSDDDMADELGDEFNKYHKPVEDDEAVLGEEDEFGPEIGDEVDYNEGRYKLYGYCGYEVVLQNVDDERDFKVVKPVDIGMGTKTQQVRETEYIDPEQLPDDQEEQI